MADISIPPKPRKAATSRSDDAHVCARAKVRRYPLVIVQGIGRSSASSNSLRNHFQQLEHEVYFLPLPLYGLGDIVKNAYYLQRKMDEFKILLSASHLDVICQGEAGLVLRYCLERLGQLKYLNKVIFLGTPTRGTYRLILLPLMPASRQVMPFSSIIKWLGASPALPEAAHRYVSIYSRYGSFYLPGRSGYLPGAHNVKIRWLCSSPNLTRSRRVLTLLLDILEERDASGEATPRDAESARQLQEASEIIREQPEDAGALVIRGKYYLERSCWDLAIQDLSAAIKLKQDLPDAYFLRAMAFRRKLRYDENPIHNRAVRDLSRTISMKPGFAEAYYERGVCYALLNVWSEALEDWEHALILNRDYHAAYLARGLARRKMGDTREAFEDFKEVLRLHPDNQDAVRMIAELGAALQRSSETQAPHPGA
jgi:tetratricopeptide (TPR) repeat protein